MYEMSLLGGIDNINDTITGLNNFYCDAINDIPSEKINYLGNVTSDIQSQIDQINTAFGGWSFNISASTPQLDQSYFTYVTGDNITTVADFTIQNDCILKTITIDTEYQLNETIVIGIKGNFINATFSNTTHIVINNLNINYIKNELYAMDVIQANSYANATFILTFEIEKTSIYSFLKNVGVGPTGAKGDSGTIGPQGQMGSQGPQGIQGIQGFTGPTGPIGPQGLQGPQGSQGSQGPQGDEGPEGPAGPEGPKGSKGDPGDTPDVLGIVNLAISGLGLVVGGVAYGTLTGAVVALQGEIAALGTTVLGLEVNVTTLEYKVGNISRDDLNPTNTNILGDLTLNYNVLGGVPKLRIKNLSNDDEGGMFLTNSGLYFKNDDGVIECEYSKNNIISNGIITANNGITSNGPISTSSTLSVDGGITTYSNLTVLNNFISNQGVHISTPYLTSPFIEIRNTQNIPYIRINDEGFYVMNSSMNNYKSLVESNRFEISDIYNNQYIKVNTDGFYVMNSNTNNVRTSLESSGYLNFFDNQNRNTLFLGNNVLSFQNYNGNSVIPINSTIQSTLDTTDPNRTIMSLVSDAINSYTTLASNFIGPMTNFISNLAQRLRITYPTNRRIEMQLFANGSNDAGSVQQNTTKEYDALIRVDGSSTGKGTGGLTLLAGIINLVGIVMVNGVEIFNANNDYSNAVQLSYVAQF